MNIPNWYPPDTPIYTEAEVHPHILIEYAHLFTAYDGETTELELLNWLHATILLLKPRHILETGTASGIGTLALAHACSLNGTGHVHTIEQCPDSCAKATTLLTTYGLNEYVTIHNTNSIDYLNQSSIVFDIAFYDSATNIRAQEFITCLNNHTIKTLAIFHDTSPHRCQSMYEPDHAHYRTQLQMLARDPRCTGYYESPLSRGFTAIFIKP